MAWMSDEQYELMQDTRDKSITARSARHTRTHNGKTGCTFSHEKLTKKELKKMSGECKTYRMNAPMTWTDFKDMPDDLKVCYIQALREKYNVPDSAIAEMFGVRKPTVCAVFSKLGLAKGAGNGSRNWDKDGFYAWRAGKTVTVKKTEEPGKTVTVKKNEEPVDICEKDELIAVNEEPEIVVKEDPIAEELFYEKADSVTLGEPIEDQTENQTTAAMCAGPTLSAIPKTGTMTFENDHSEDALETIKAILRGARVNITVTWECIW